MCNQSATDALLPVVLRRYDPKTDSGDNVAAQILASAQRRGSWDHGVVHDISRGVGAVIDALREGATLMLGDTIHVYPASGNTRDTRVVALHGSVRRNGQIVGGFVPTP